MKRQEKLAYIGERLDHLCSYVKFCGDNNLQDINIIAEGFLRDLLNIMYEYNCEDMNKRKKNFPGIDLGNEARGIGIQVTSTCSSKKVIDTYRIIFDKRNAVAGKLVADMFSNRVIFVCISMDKKINFKKKTLEKINTISHGRFKEEDIITFNDLFSDIEGLFDNDNDRFIKVYKCISDNIDTLPLPVTDKIVLEELLHYFNRPSFTVDFQYECSLEDFEEAITETISNINIGRNDLKIGHTLSVEDLNSRELKARFGKIVEGLNLIRNLYLVMLYKKYGCKVNVDIDHVIYTDCEVVFCRAMNDSRAVILYELKKIADSEKIDFGILPDYYKDSICYSPIIRNNKGDFLTVLKNIIEIYGDEQKYRSLFI
ncbi:MAG: SMEK domain-containing protein [Clostridiales bacterium]|nr:SMEK domain-containing protein [Clostridiales bacterium]